MFSMVDLGCMFSTSLETLLIILQLKFAFETKCSGFVKKSADFI